MKNLKQLTHILIPTIIGFSAIHVNAANSNVPVIPADGVIQPRVELNQGWNKEKRQLFWFTSQGSRAIPYSLYALEQASV